MRPRPSARALALRRVCLALGLLPRVSAPPPARLADAPASVAPPMPVCPEPAVPWTRSPLVWRGGKFYLASRLVPLLPPHVCWVELFCGAAWVTFRKTRSPLEVLNDINGDLMNVFLVLRDRPRELYDRCLWTRPSRSLFESLKNSASQDPVERAWRFLYLCHYGHPDPARSYFVPFRRPHTMPTASDLRRRLMRAHLRLERVILECLPWHKVLAHYDSPGTLFYVDPPYYGHENDYGRGLFAREDFRRLAAALDGIRGKFVLSINDTPQTREIFSRFHILGEHSARYSVNCRRHAIRKPELIVANFTPARRAPAPRRSAHA